MKRLLTFSAALAVAGLLFPSCGTHMTIAKRQHSKGYYVDISRDKKAAGGQQAVSEEHAAGEATVAPPVRVKPGTVGAGHVLKHTTEETITASAAETSTIRAEEQQAPATSKISRKAEKIGKAGFEKLALQENTADADHSFKANVKQEAKKLSEHAQVKKMESKRVSDGLSLFWIVILILLILWALGLIGGLGWFIHIALVVALICLILWLLGVV